MQTAETDRKAEVERVRRDAQREVNALAARLAELQAQANRLNALGARLTQWAGQLQDGEPEFDKPVGRVAPGAPARCRRANCASASPRWRASTAADTQLSVLEQLLIPTARWTAMRCPSRDPIANSYVTSGFRRPRWIRSAAAGSSTRASISRPTSATGAGGGRRRGQLCRRAFRLRQRGRDRPRQQLRDALCAQPRLERQVGDLVRAGQEIAKAGSTGRSTGAHVHFEVWQDGVVVNPRSSWATTTRSRAPRADARLTTRRACERRRPPPATLTTLERRPAPFRCHAMPGCGAPARIPREPGPMLNSLLTGLSVAATNACSSNSAASSRRSTPSNRRCRRCRTTR